MTAMSTTRYSVSPATLAAFAAGGFTMLTALIFLSPFALSPYAGQNDVYMGNLLLSPLLFLVGSVLFIVSLAGLGLSPQITVLLAVADLVPPLLILYLPGSMLGASMRLGPYAIVFLALLFEAGLLIILGLVIARAHGWQQAWLEGLLLVGAGSGLMALVYVLFGGRYHSVGPNAPDWPPYLTMPVLGVALGLGLAIFVIGWAWGKMTARRQATAG